MEDLLILILNANLRLCILPVSLRESPKIRSNGWEFPIGCAPAVETEQQTSQDRAAMSPAAYIVGRGRANWRAVVAYSESGHASHSLLVGFVGAVSESSLSDVAQQTRWPTSDLITEDAQTTAVGKLWR
jgi:Flp pilus assembly CpaE family ATPase